MGRILGILLICMPILVGAQPVWNLVEADNNKSRIINTSLFQDSIIIATGYVSTESCRYQKLFAFHIHGQKLWTDRTRYYDVIHTDANYIYTVGFESEIDDVSGYYQLLLTKYDRLGQEVSHVAYPDIPNDSDFWFYPNGMDVSESGVILVSSDSAILKLIDTEVSVFELSTEENIEGILALSDEEYLINAYNKIYKTDSELNKIDSVAFPGPIIEMQIRDGVIYTLFNADLVRINTDLTILDTLYSSESSLQYVEYYNDQIWIHEEGGDQIQLIQLDEFDGHDTLTYPLWADNPQFVVTENQITFIGNSFSKQIGMYTFPIGQNTFGPEILPDIELVDFDIEVTSVDYNEEHGWFWSYIFTSEVTVRNNGQDTIEDFKVFSRLDGGFNCAQHHLYRTISEANILPGETKTFHLGPESQYSGNTVLCYEVLAPNALLEVRTEDNAMCKTFLLTSTGEENRTALRIYPNPITDYILIEHPEQIINQVTVLDLNGRVLKGQSSSGSVIRMDISSLPPGPYLLRVKVGNEVNAQVVFKI